MHKVMITFSSGPGSAIKSGAFAEVAQLAPGIGIDLPRSTDDIVPRDGLPRVLFHPPTMGPVDALVSCWADNADALPALYEAACASGARAGLGSPAGYVMKEHVVKNTKTGVDPGSPTPGLKMINIGRRHPSMTVEEFERHWRTIHGPLAVRHHVGMWRYVQDLVLERWGAARDDVDSIAELSFRSVDDFVGGLYDSHEGRRIIAADANTFGGGGDTHFLTETILKRPTRSNR